MSEANNQTTPTLRRAFLFLEDGEWEKADEYCEKTLDAEPENAEAYLVKLLVELRLKSRTMLSETTASLDDNPHFQKIMRFGSDELKKELQEYNNAVKLRLEENRKREQQLQITQTYENAVSLFNSAQTVAECETAANIFRSVSGFADANSYVEKCAEKAEICRKNAIYTTAKAKMAQPSVENYGYAKQLLATISGWDDADALAAECDAGIQRIYEQQQAAQIEAERQEQIRREITAKRAKKLKKAAIIVATALVVVAAGVFSFIKFALPAIKYNKALKLIEKEEYANAYDMLEALGDYKDCEKLRKDFIIRFETKIDSEGYVTKYTYDDNANKTKIICRDENGDIVSSYEYEYDENGNEIKYIWYDGNGDIADWYEYEYDTDGNQIKETNYSSDGEIYDWTEYEYDRSGNQIKSTDYSSYGEITDWTEYEYDKDGNQIKSTDYSSNGEISDWYEYEYDTDGNQTKATRYSPSGEIRGWGKYKYDKKGNVIKSEFTNGDGNIEVWEYEYTYGDKDNILKDVAYLDGEKCELREYDKHGNLIKYIDYDENGETNYRLKYKYKDPVVFYKIDKEK